MQIWQEFKEGNYEMQVNRKDDFYIEDQTSAAQKVDKWSKVSTSVIFFFFIGVEMIMTKKGMSLII